MTTLSTSVPDTTISENGLSVPEVADILSGRMTDITAIMGGDSSTSLSSRQGQIAQSDTEIISQVYDKQAVIINQINPDYATGRFQDAIGRIYFMDRISAAGTVVTATCYGKPNTSLPIGITAIDDAGYIYATTSAYIIPSAGSIDVLFTCQTTGAIACGAGELKQIYKPISGWDSVYNSSAGSVGNDVESRIAFETRRRNSVARASRSLDGSVRAALLSVSGVLDAYVYSNRSGTAITYGETAVTIPAHCYWICVYGGASSDIAEAIFNTYNPGCDMTGGTTYTISDTSYSVPYPTYDIEWKTATATPVYFKVDIDKSLNPPSDITDQVKAMIAEVFNGGYSGIDKARIGALINAGKFYAPVISIDSSSVGVNGITISLDNSTFSASVTMGVDQVPTIDEDNIVVTLS